MSMEFHVGAQVVCVDDTYWPEDVGDRLEKGRVYTIRKIEPEECFHGEDNVRVTMPGIWLEEARRKFKAPVWNDPKDAPWGAVRFRPVRKTDISVFTAMLTPTKVTEDA